MYCKDILFISIRNILTRKIQSIMIIASIAFAVAVSINVSGIIQYFYYDFDERIEKNPDFKRVDVWPRAISSNNNFAVEKIGRENNTKINLSLNDLRELKDLSLNIDFAYIIEQSKFTIGDDPWGRTPEKTLSEDLSSETIPPNSEIDAFWGIATVNDFFEFYDITVSTGSRFLQEDIELGAQALLVGTNLKKKLFPELKESEVIGNKIKLNGRMFKIIGILNTVSDDKLLNGKNINNLSFFPITACWTYLHRKYPRDLNFGANSTMNAIKAKNDIKQFYNQKFGSDYFYIYSQVEGLNDQKAQIIAPLFVVIVMAGSVLLIAAINMFNIMFAQVMERSKGISISFSLGASKESIFIQILSETFVLYVVGAIFGSLVSFIFLKIFTRSLNVFNSTIKITTSNLLVSLFITFFLTLLFTLYPVIRASRISPIANIN